MYSQEDIEKLKELVLLHVHGASEILLFGSYARGTATDDSDIDIVALVDNEIERKEKLKLLARLRSSFAALGYNADILIKSKNTYLKEISLPTLARRIREEGIRLWTKS